MYIYLIFTICCAAIFLLLINARKRTTDKIIDFINRNQDENEKTVTYGTCTTFLLIAVSVFIPAILADLRPERFGIISLGVAIIALFFLRYIITVKLSEMIILTDKAIIFTSNKNIESGYIKKKIYFNEIKSSKYTGGLKRTLTLTLTNDETESAVNLSNLKTICEYIKEK